VFDRDRRFMKKGSPVAIIISISSDIGHALALRWQSKGFNVYGTYRTPSSKIDELNALGIKTVHCDLTDNTSIQESCSFLSKTCLHWDYLVICPGLQDPVDSFAGCDFSQWEQSINVNFIKQMQIIHELLPFRSKAASKPPVVLLFAGGGTNNATVNYSAYTVSKIALIKMCELLDAEIPDTSFTILGPGWVRTKIHESTLKAGTKAESNYQKTIEKLGGKDCTPMEKVLDCCDWIINEERNVIGGRNFSVVFDQWGTGELKVSLLKDPNMYKLRRHGNERLIKI